MRLPASRVLAAELRVSRGVVVEAYDELHAQGFLRVAPRSAPVVVAVPGAPRLKAPDPPPRAPLVDFSIETVDTALFDRRSWLRAYGAALDAAPGAALAYGDPRGQPDLRVALADYLGRARGGRRRSARRRHLPGLDPGRPARRAAAGAGRACGGSRSRIRAATSCAPRGRRRAGVVPLPTDAPRPGRRGARRRPVPAPSFLTPAHQYPGGGTLPPERRQALLAWARAADALLVEDDYDGELRYDRRPVGALQGLARERVIYIGTASRTLAPALRLGWIVVPPQLADDAGALRWELAAPRRRSTSWRSRGC